MLIVQKYGGSSVADEACIRRAAERVKHLHEQGHKLVVVVSAQGDTTDEMLQKVAPFHGIRRELDAFLAAGEQMSAALMAMALGANAVSLSGWQAGIHTDNVFGNARILDVDTARIRTELNSGRIVVVSGFQGISPDGNLTTLGRGGSDTTAAALAAALHADRCQIFTDVDGVYDRDPRMFPQAKKFSRISYSHMLTLAQSGAQVLHDRSIETARDSGVVLEVLSAFTDAPGTLVCDTV